MLPKLAEFDKPSLPNHGVSKTKYLSTSQPGGFVLYSIHIVQGNSPIENVGTMFRTIRESHL